MFTQQHVLEALLILHLLIESTVSRFNSSHTKRESLLQYVVTIPRWRTHPQRVNSIKNMTKSEISRRRLKTHVSNTDENPPPAVPNSPSEDVAMEEARQCESPEITNEKVGDEKELSEDGDRESEAEEAPLPSPTFEGFSPGDDDGEEVWEPNRGTHVDHDGTNSEHGEESCTDDEDDD